MLKVNQDSIETATEGAIWGASSSMALLAKTDIISVDTGQFNIGEDGLRREPSLPAQCPEDPRCRASRSMRVTISTSQTIGQSC